MQFTLNYLNTTKEFNKNVRLLDLIPEEDKKKYICARVNNRVRELTYEVYYDANIEFCTVSDRDAMRIYEGSLRYVVAMAFDRVYPGLKIRFCYNVSRSVFVQLLDTTVRADLHMVKAIQEEVDRIIKSDFEFKRIKIRNEEAKDIYLKHGLLDKLDILKYRPEETVHLYDCDGYLNYMYIRMVPSTGYLKDYKILPYSPGLIIQYPRAECNGMIPRFKDAPTFGKVLKESHEWAQIAGADTVAGINEHIHQDGVIDFIQLCEARHNRMLAELGENIEADISNIRLICIAGPSSSGKTTFANSIKNRIIITWN